MLRFITEGGTGVLAKIINVETGEDVTKLLSIGYGVKITIDHMVTAECQLSMLETDIVAGKTIFSTKHPITGEHEPVAAIEFRDGSRIVIADDGTPMPVA